MGVIMTVLTTPERGAGRKAAAILSSNRKPPNRCASPDVRLMRSLWRAGQKCPSDISTDNLATYYGHDNLF